MYLKYCEFYDKYVEMSTIAGRKENLKHLRGRFKSLD
jgi:hypothetical protein